MLEELLDRFGEPPRSVQNLLAIANLKRRAHDAWILELAQKGNKVRITLYEHAQIDTAKIDPLLKKYRGRMGFTIEKNPYFTYNCNYGGKKETLDMLTLAQKLVGEFEAIRLA